MVLLGLGAAGGLRWVGNRETSEAPSLLDGHQAAPDVQQSNSSPEFGPNPATSSTSVRMEDQAR